MDKLAVIGFILAATVLESVGDALVRLGLHSGALWPRISFFTAGAALLFGYGTSLNLAPLEFGRVVGLYVAMLFVMFQIVNLVIFRIAPTPPVLIGGALVVVGGLIVSFWPTAQAS
jgi:hypothetical protein